MNPALLALLGARIAATGAPLTVTYLQSNDSADDLATYTFSAQNLGAESATRTVVAIVIGRKAPPSTTLVSATIGGVSATIAPIQSQVEGSTVAMIYAAVPAGTTGDVVLTWSVAVLRCGVALWRSVGGPVAVEAVAVAPTLSGSIAGVAGGSVIGGAVSRITNADFNWTGATELAERFVESATTWTVGQTNSVGALTINAHPTLEYPTRAFLIAAIRPQGA